MTLLTALAHVLKVLVGYFAACVAAGGFAAVAVANGAGLLARITPETVLEMIVFGGQIAVFAGRLAFWPAMIAAVLAEALRIRSLLYWLAVGVAIALLPSFPPDRFAGAVDERMLTIEIASGLIGAIVYWTLAGRWAGAWWKSPHAKF